MAPPGDEHYRRLDGPDWPQAPVLRHDIPHAERCKLTPFWIRKPAAWFAWAESSFNRCHVDDTRARFDLVLTALSEDMLDRIGSVLATVDELPDPYETLKGRLMEMFAVDPMDRMYGLLFAAELGDRRPSQMMDDLLAMLPTGERDGLLFKAIFLTRLPDDLKILVAPLAKTMESRPLAAYADQLWIARNSKKAAKPVAMVADPSLELASKVDELAGVVAAMRTAQPPKRPNKRAGRGGRGGHGGGSGESKFVCWRHELYKERAFKCEEPGRCTWSGNCPAGQ